MENFYTYSLHVTVTYTCEIFRAELGMGEISHRYCIDAWLSWDGCVLQSPLSGGENPQKDEGGQYYYYYYYEHFGRLI